MQNEITINGKALPVREYQGKRVVTLKDVATLHGQSLSTIRHNFNNNRKHFIENQDYYLLEGSCVKKLHTDPYTQKLNIFTESGYLMLVKSLTGDVAWQVQRELVNRYFASTSRAIVRQDNHIADAGKMVVDARLTAMAPLLQRPYRALWYYRVHRQLTQKETARIIGVNTSMIQEMEKRMRGAGMTVPSVKDLDVGIRRRLLSELPSDVDEV